MTCPLHSLLPARENENKAAIVAADKEWPRPSSLGSAGLVCEGCRLTVTTHVPFSLSLFFIRGLIKL